MCICKQSAAVGVARCGRDSCRKDVACVRQWTRSARGKTGTAAALRSRPCHLALTALPFVRPAAIQPPGKAFGTPPNRSPRRQGEKWEMHRGIDRPGGVVMNEAGAPVPGKFRTCKVHPTERLAMSMKGLERAFIAAGGTEAGFGMLMLRWLAPQNKRELFALFTIPNGPAKFLAGELTLRHRNGHLFWVTTKPRQQRVD